MYRYMVGLYRESMEILEDLCKDEVYGRSISTARVTLMEVLWMLQYVDVQLLGSQFAKKMHLSLIHI